MVTHLDFTFGKIDRDKDDEEPKGERISTNMGGLLPLHTKGGGR